MKTKKFFTEFSREYEAQNRYSLLFYRRMIGTIIRQIGKRSRRILDLGTGTGELALRIAVRFPKSKVIGIDISSGMLGVARAKADRLGLRNVSFAVSPLERVSKRANFAVSMAAFHHVKDKATAIRRIYGLLPRVGKLVIGDWFKPSAKYRKEVAAMRRKYPKQTKQFDASWRAALRAMSGEYGAKHPTEYPICPTELRDIMKNAGFRRQRVIKSLLPNFAVVVGEK